MMTLSLHKFSTKKRNRNSRLKFNPLPERMKQGMAGSRVQFGRSEANANEWGGFADVVHQLWRSKRVAGAANL